MHIFTKSNVVSSWQNILSCLICAPFEALWIVTQQSPDHEEEIRGRWLMVWLPRHHSFRVHVIHLLMRWPNPNPSVCHPWNISWSNIMHHDCYRGHEQARVSKVIKYGQRSSYLSSSCRLTCWLPILGIRTRFVRTYNSTTSQLLLKIYFTFQKTPIIDTHLTGTIALCISIMIALA